MVLAVGSVLPVSTTGSLPLFQVVQKMFAEALGDMANFNDATTLDSFIEQTPYKLAGIVDVLLPFATQIGGSLSLYTESLKELLESWIPKFNDMTQEDINALDSQPSYKEAVLKIAGLSQACINEIQKLTFITDQDYGSALTQSVGGLISFLNQTGYGNQLGNNSVGTFFGQSNAFRVSGQIFALTTNSEIAKILQPGIDPAENAGIWAAQWPNGPIMPGLEPRGLTAYTDMIAAMQTFLKDLDNREIPALNPPEPPLPSAFPIEPKIAGSCSVQ